MPVHRLSRRTVLRGLGTAVALPLLEAMSLPWRATIAASARAKNPVRLAWLHTTTGMRMPYFTPQKKGADFELRYILEPLADFRKDVSVLSGLFHAGAFKTGPALGRHDQDEVCHLTGADLGRIPGVAIKNSVSVDQVAGRHLGQETRLPTLNLSIATWSRLIFDESGTLIPPDTQPAAIWDRLFVPPPANPAERARMAAREDGVLDRITESTRLLNARLGANDRRTLDEYLTGLREVEKRVKTARKWAERPPIAPPAGATRPTGEPATLTDRIRLLIDLAVLAFQTDQTRVLTLHLGTGSDRFPEIGAGDGYHGYTHTNYKDYDAAKNDPMAKIDRRRVELFAYFLGKLRNLREGEGTVLDSAVVHYGSGMGLWHESTDLPNLVAGRGGNMLPTGSHVDFGGKPLANLYLSMLHAAGVPGDKFADSTSRLPGT